jgi:hypothetical protein
MGEGLDRLLGFRIQIAVMWVENQSLDMYKAYMYPIGSGLNQRLTVLVMDERLELSNSPFTVCYDSQDNFIIRRK